MNKLIRRTFNVLAIVMLVFAMNIVAFAQGTTMIAVSKNSPAVGDKVTVSVTASESGTITVKYTSAMLTFVSCTGSGYTTSGNSVSFSGKTGDVVFTAAASGTASIIVSSTSCSGSSTTLSIGGGSAPAEPVAQEQPAAQVTEEPADEPVAEETPVEEPTETAPVETAAPTGGAVGTLNASGGFDINGVAYVVSERYSDSEVPSGFSKTTVNIGSSTYSEPTNGSITLLYLKPADNTSGSGVFYLYNAEAGTVSEFLMLGSGKNYVIISPSDAGPSSAFTPMSLDVTGGNTTAYTIGESGFYYVYGTNAAGDTGWFVFDSANDTLSRMDESVLSAGGSSSDVSEEDTSAAVNDNVDIYINKLDTYRKVIMGLIVLCVILVFLLINTFVKSRDRDDDFDGDVFAETPAKKKSARRSPRSIVFDRRSREEEEEEYDEEEYDDEYVDEEEEYDDEYEDTRSTTYIESASDYDSRRNSSLNMMDLNDL
ncbi:hypothetical protein [Pseudobutyrivibrio xylanivorans]|uniref:Cohesin domain-containing protein n=1 Tax=Pseudobutyrivibrio xylanivorans DSM 14809 TaxID=1123012 RepID=A0A1M6LFS4_PSEXY|nr:hypothetical protein [Pseudobutyrivibrio xylanivorans]SHJ69996.1 hypothetical protein SAMN02745725_03097 [Pseudobutyrivibrio xylanivorans DSM 14809]